VKVAVAQFEPTGDVEANQAVIEYMAGQAVRSGAEAVIFPEESMTPSGAVSSLAEVAAAHWPGFLGHLRSTAARLGIAIIAGGFEGGASALPYNSIAAVDADGALLGVYRKMHLYDAFAYQESRYVMRGDDGPCVVRIGGFNMGLVNCYDVRFPEFTRSLVEMGADVLAISAAWVRGPLKEDHWSTLVRCRAIENTCWVLASSRSGSDCIGQSLAVDPLGVVRGALGEEPQALLTVEITKERLDHARATLPVLRNRRIIVGQG
jgi:predicted amidohydrolase